MVDTLTYLACIFVVLVLISISAERRAKYGYHLFQHLDHYLDYRLSSNSNIYTLCTYIMQFYNFDSNNDFAQLHKISSHVYLSNRYGAWNLKLLQKKNITHVLVVGEELSLYFPNNFIYQKLFFRDDASETESLKFRSSISTALTFITTALRDPNNNVLVHCSAGISRSPAIVAAYLIYSEEHSMNVDDALTWIRRIRTIVQPNDGFVTQLKQFHMQVEANRKGKSYKKRIRKF